MDMPAMIARDRAGDRQAEADPAGLAVARAFGMPASGLRNAVATFAAGKMRGERTVRNGIVVLND